MIFICTKCGAGKEQNIENFNLRDPAAKVYKRWCRECERAYSKERYQKNKQKMATGSIEWQARNRDKYLEYQKEYNRVRRARADGDGEERVE